MNLQELLDYRSTCLIHNLPIGVWGGVQKSKVGSPKLEYIKIPEGIKAHRKGDTGEGDIFRFDGTCKVDYGFTMKHSSFPWTIGLMCPECHRTPVHLFGERGVPTLENIKHQVHYYTFSLTPQVPTEVSKETNCIECTYVCNPGLEVVKYFDNDKFYHLNARIDGGAASFTMGCLDSEDILDQLISSTSTLKVPRFNPAVIKDVNQMMQKMKIYNLFS